MTGRDSAIERIGRTRIIAILRGDLRGNAIPVCETLVAEGISAIEVSLVSPNAVEAIAELAAHFGDRASIGAGTVLDTAAAERVHAAGGAFVVSPDCAPEVIECTRALDMASFPGAYTPTEVVRAMRAGADAVKLFPALALGPAYVRALHAPLPEVRLVPTGGVTVDNVAGYLQAGAFAVGIASELVSSADLANPASEALRAKARAFAGAVAGVARG